MSNPLRVQILGTISAAPATTAQLSNEIGASLAAVGYHTRVLCRSGCIHPADEATGGFSTDRLFEASR